MLITKQTLKISGGKKDCSVTGGVEIRVYPILWGENYDENLWKTQKSIPCKYKMQTIRYLENIIIESFYDPIVVRKDFLNKNKKTQSISSGEWSSI